MQRTEDDCAVVALAIIAQVGYQDVRRIHTTPQKGMSPLQMQRTSRKLGVSLKQVPWDPDESQTGVAFVYQAHENPGHCIVIFQGVVWDPSNGMLWGREAYLHDTGRSIETFLVRR